MRRKLYFNLRSQFVIVSVVLSMIVIILVTFMFYVSVRYQVFDFEQSIGVTGEELNKIEQSLVEKYSVIFRDLLVPIIVILFIAGLLGSLFGLYLSRPLQTLLNTIREIDVKQIGKKNKRVRFERGGKLLYRDEMDDLIREFNELYEAVEGRYRHLNTEVAEQTEALQRSNQTLRDFVYYRAHRMRTPLNVIRWSTDILKSEELGRLNPKQRETVSDLEEALFSVIELSDDLLESLAMEKQEKVTLQTHGKNIADLIDNVARDLAALARERGVEVKWEQPKQIFRSYVDEGRILHAFKKILENAILYNHEGGSVRIKLEATSEIAPQNIRMKHHFPNRNGSFLQISIEDTGIEIPEEEVRYVFDRFFRGKGARAKWVDGVGIGLSVARSVIQLHGGAMWFVSNKGKGSTFVIRLPREK